MKPDLLTRFLDSHPEYFEELGNTFSLRGDLRPIFEEYAQAMDPVEYEDLRRKVEAFRKQEKSRLQGKIEKLVKVRKQEESELSSIVSQMTKLEGEVNQLEKQLNEITRSNGSGAHAVSKSWYNSGYTFLLLDFLGVLFLYIGIILKERLTMSYVLMGLFSVSLGFYLQQSSAQVKRATSPAMDNVRQDLSHRWMEMRQIFKVRRVTLLTKKKSTLSKIEEVNRKIESNLQKINDYNRE